MYTSVQATVVLKNVSGASRQLRVIPLDSPFFKVQTGTVLGTTLAQYLTKVTCIYVHVFCVYRHIKYMYTCVTNWWWWGGGVIKGKKSAAFVY